MIGANFIIGAIFVIMIFLGVTNKQLTKIKQLEKRYIEYEESGLNVTKFCKKFGIHRSKFYYWLPRYEKQKKAGLIDRRMGTPFKTKDQRRNFIINLKINKPLHSSEDISAEFRKKFKTKITSRRVSQILKEENLNDPVGRKTGKRFKKTID